MKLPKGPVREISSSQFSNQRISFVAVSVWYEPEIWFLANISSYVNSVDHVVIVDNSATDNGHMLSNLENVIYIPLKRNAGIAAALNFGFKEAARLGADWVLTMDQDSRFENDELEALKKTVLSLSQDKNIAAVGCITDQDQVTDLKIKEVRKVITSGSLNRLSSFQAIGGFDEKLFIDCVDFDFCLRLREAGFRIIRDESVTLDHRRGAPTVVRLCGRRFTSYNYDATRYYYQVRNNLYLGRRFLEYRKSSRRKILRIVRNVLLFEDKKIHNLGAIMQGIMHFIIGRYGPRKRMRD